MIEESDNLDPKEVLVKIYSFDTYAHLFYD